MRLTRENVRVGMKVRVRMGEGHREEGGPRLLEGATYTVARLPDSYGHLHLEEKETHDVFGWNRSRFDVAEEQDDLDRLIEEANAGLAAIKTIFEEHGGERYFEWDGPNACGPQYKLVYPNGVRHISRVFKVLPASTIKFQDFTTSNGWEVSLRSDGGLKLGCRTFTALAFFNGLHHVLHKINGDMRNRVILLGHKDGVYQEACPHDVLPWDDAERLYEELKKVEGELK
jgi:hypothetical protein